MPHSALLNGEIIDNITVRYISFDRKEYTYRPILDRDFVIKTYTSATIGELKAQIAKILGAHSRYV